jgi:hypothetical protein
MQVIDYSGFDSLVRNGNYHSNNMQLAEKGYVFSIHILDPVPRNDKLYFRNRNDSKLLPNIESAFLKSGILNEST